MDIVHCYKWVTQCVIYVYVLLSLKCVVDHCGERLSSLPTYLPIAVALTLLFMHLCLLESADDKNITSCRVHPMHYEIDIHQSWKAFFCISFVLILRFHVCIVLKCVNFISFVRCTKYTNSPCLNQFNVQTVCLSQENMNLVARKHDCCMRTTKRLYYLFLCKGWYVNLLHTEFHFSSYSL